jgi:hypothetical protein
MTAVNMPATKYQAGRNRGENAVEMRLDAASNLITIADDNLVTISGEYLVAKQSAYRRLAASTYNIDDSK